LIHQLTFPAAFAERVRLLHLPLEQGLQHPSMWISYAPVSAGRRARVTGLCICM
jgi:hypothetical protein